MFTFPKSHRLTGDIRIARLYAQGKAFIAYPLRVIYLPEPKTDNLPPARIVISVPKKRLKKATGRNLIKRRIREAYRLNNHKFLSFLSEKDYMLNFGINYVANELLPYATIEKKMKEALEKMMEILE